jgi:hypothetical protein
MLLMMILVWIGLYVLLSIGFVWLVRQFTQKKIYRWLAIAFVILLPTWDIILGYLVYFPACYFIPKTAIYETAETDGIYYEGDHKNYIFDLDNGQKIVTLASLDWKKGYAYMESLVTEQEIMGSKKKMTPIVYRCTSTTKPPQNHNIQCVPVSDIQSGYLVTVKKIKLGIAEIHFMKIQNRSTGKLMAEYNEVIAGNKKNFISFIDLTQVGEGGGSIDCCPKKSRFYDFQYDVLKPKK